MSVEISFEGTKRMSFQQIPFMEKGNVHFHKSLKSEAYTPLHLKRKNKHDRVDSLRKKKRKEHIKKLRAMNSYEGGTKASFDREDGPVPDSNSPKTIPANAKDLVSAFMKVENIQEVCDLIRRLRILVSISQEMTMDTVKSIFQFEDTTAFFQLLFEKMKAASHEVNLPAATELLYDSLWFLTNIVGGEREYCSCVVNAGCLQCLQEIFQTIGNVSSSKIIDQMVWLIANIASEYSDEVLRISLHKPLQKILEIEILTQPPEDWCSSVLNHTLWGLTSILKGVQVVQLFEFKPTISILLEAFFVSQDDLLLERICVIFLEFSKKSDESVDDLLKLHSNFTNRLMDLVIKIRQSLDCTNCCSKSFAKVCLKLLSSITYSSSINHFQLILENKRLLEALQYLLSARDESVKKEVAFSFSNLFVGSPSQVDLLLYFEGNGSLIRELVKTYWTSSIQVKRECVIALCNAILCASVDSKKLLVESKLIFPILVQTLRTGNTKLIIRALEAIECILDVGSQLEGFSNPYADLLEMEEGDSELENLQSKSVSASVCEKVTRILTNHFDHCCL